MSGGEILCDLQNGVACITLNRPAALNALSLGMIVELHAELRRCAHDPQVLAVLLRGAGEKAFCAGGDIRALYQSSKESGSIHHEFFAAEYPLDYCLHTYCKPYVAVLDGITMGGGMGLGQGSRLRLVGERTRIAMPEVGIGLFPDVGASYFLSRLPGGMGPYLALTGIQLRAADSLYARLADAYLAPAAMQAFIQDLGSLVWTDDPAADLRALVSVHATPPPPAPLSPLQPAIDRHFSLPTVGAIIAALEEEKEPAYAEWARQTAKLMRRGSPTMLAVTLRQLERGKSMSLDDCFRMELGMAAQCFVQGDIIEGVRALIIDKDNAPRWQPGHLDQVTEASVDAFFRQRWHGAEHPLANLASANLEQQQS